MRLQNRPIHEISSKSDSGKVVKYTGKIFCGEISQGEGKFGGGISKKKWKATNFHPKMNICTKFHPNQKMGKWSNLEGKFSGGEIYGGNFEKKMKTYEMQLQNKPICEISSKSDNGKVVKYTGFHFLVCTKFHQNQKMWNWSNLEGKFSEGEIYREGGNLGEEFWKKKMKTYKIR